MVPNILRVFFIVTIRALAWGYFKSPPGVRNLAIQCIAAILRGFKIRREVVRENLKRAFPGEDPVILLRRRDLERAAYSHLAQLIFEILLVMANREHLFSEFLKNEVRVEGMEIWKNAVSQGRGTIFLSSHVGNWEVLAASGAIRGMRPMMVTKHLKPELLHLAMEGGRKRVGVIGTYEPHTLKAALKHLRGGGDLGMILDQYAGPPIGVRVPFFGVPVGTAAVIAMLAKRTGAVVLPVVNFREETGHFIVKIEPAMGWIENENPAYELAVNTAKYVEVIERHVRAHPEQWLWTHRRFKGDLSPLKPEEWSNIRARR